MDTQTIMIIASFIILVGLAALVFWPRNGLAARWRDWQQAIQRQRIEDALKYIFNLQLEDQVATIDALSGALHLSQRKVLSLVAQMQSQDLIQQHGSRLTLTPTGQSWALQVVRAHRLWERYLADEARLPLERIHELAHKLEHRSSQEQIDDLDAALGHPIRDPHGDPIPNAAGVMRQKTDQGELTTALTDWKAGQRGKIVHLEDEPPVVYAQLIAEGLMLNQWVTVLASSNERITLTDGQREMNIAPAIAANVYLEQPRKSERELSEAVPLSELKNRSKAHIVMLDERCQGFTRRRFLDLGLTPGTEISPELDNFFREPRAYRVRGTLIALRNDQASMILVKPELS